MKNIFNYERGKTLFESEEKDLLSFSERSKTAEHSLFERSGTPASSEDENSQKLKKTDEN